MTKPLLALVAPTTVIGTVVGRSRPPRRKRNAEARAQLPASGVFYRAFVDPSGGSDDSMTLAIGHRTRDKNIVIDAVREARPPFSPSAVVDDFAVLLKNYRVRKVDGDHYGGEFVKESFRRHGISYDVCKQPKSDLFRDMLPLLNSGHITLPRHDRLIAQIAGLERRVSRAGRDSIDHAPGAHDDLANAVAGAAAAAKRGGYSLDWLDSEHMARSWEHLRFQTYINSGGRIRLW
jgi:hypothetical protein